MMNYIERGRFRVDHTLNPIKSVWSEWSKFFSHPQVCSHDLKQNDKFVIVTGHRGRCI